ncbi:unnamed protein product [Eruca vesicaria subsp. sativa]|uniref:Uncharacterized protein n=1 Tax=Eruca vesicaria subsp. sativa TaxID=29727 RepID=A0ABC8KVJ4_ERUVS|nr:unnamed protein product [Eruca vesicaria subsp. sativa]
MGISISSKSSNPEKKRRCSKGMVIRASLFGVGAPEALECNLFSLPLISWHFPAFLHGGSSDELFWQHHLLFVPLLNSEDLTMHTL